MEKKTNNTHNQDKPNGTLPQNILRPSLTIDYALYQKYFDESDLTEAQQREFLDVFWLMIVTFVDLGFGVHPLQQVEGECGQVDNLTEVFPGMSAGMIECDQQAGSSEKTINGRPSSSLNKPSRERSHNEE